MRNIQNTSSITSKSHNIIAWSLLIGLLLLRIPFLGFIALFAKPVWLDPIFEIGTYLLTACLIWWERDRLADFHIDTLALLIIILFKPIQTILLYQMKITNNPLAFPNIGSIVLWIISVALILSLWKSHFHITIISKSSIEWFGFGILAGLIAVIILGYPMSLQVVKINGRPDIVSLLGEAFPGIFYQLGYAAVTEEPLFRGFLWGYLIKAGWKNIWILLFQAGLFMLGHIYYFSIHPISFWIIVPTGALIMGALVWRSKTISSSLAAHATMNAFGYTVGYIIASFRI